MKVNAQPGVMKLVGSESENYKLGFGAFIKAGYRYSFNWINNGFYIETQLGYNVYGVNVIIASKGRSFPFFWPYICKLKHT